MDTSLIPAVLITAENAQHAATLFSHVNYVISLCLTIPDQYSIKEFFASADLLPLNAKAPVPRGEPLVVFYKGTGLLQKMRGERREGVARRDSQQA